jgi:streptomycin 6-kinase
VIIPSALGEACSGSRERRDWLERLPALLDEIADRWSISVQRERPFEANASWVAPAVTAAGSAAVLKLPMPHMEAEDEIKGLRVWAGDPTVALLDADSGSGAMLLERCLPGVSLRTVAEPDQDGVIAGLLHRLWRTPAKPGDFRPLSHMVRHWRAETESDSSRWPDPSLVSQGLRTFEELASSSEDAVLLATDLHAANVLSAERHPWLVIDPKPFIGDRAFDATQHLLNCRDRLRADSAGTLSRFAQLLDLDASRVARWLFARLAAEPRTTWEAEDLMLARSFGPEESR